MTTALKTPTPAGLPAITFNRILDEGYGPGAWYGSDLRAAVAEVKAADAFKRPAARAHSVAEIALHHAYWSREIVKKLSGQESKVPFPLEGEDWFELNDGTPLSWTQIVDSRWKRGSSSWPGRCRRLRRARRPRRSARPSVSTWCSASRGTPPITRARFSS